MRRLLKKGRAREKGQSLVVILMLGALLAFFGVTLTRMLVRESINVVNTKKRDAQFLAGDAALQRSVGKLLENNAANWASPEAIPGFSSLTNTAYGFTDIQGMTVYIRIKTGALEDDTNTGAATDWHIDQWQNHGSLSQDRTIFARTVDRKGREDRFYTVVHRTPQRFFPGGAPIAAAGPVTLAGYDGHAYNSCTPVTTPTPMVNPPFCISAPTYSGSDFDFPLCTEPPEPVPTPYIPTVGPTPKPFPSKSSVTQDENYNANQTFGPSVGALGTVIRYQINDVDFGTKTMTFDASNGPIELYVTGTLEMGGSGKFTITGWNSWTCCESKALTIYMVGGGDITWNGTPDARFMLYAPESTLSMTGTGNKNLYGALIVEQMNVSGGGTGTFWFDTCLAQRPSADNYASPPIITTKWQQVGLKSQNDK